MQTPVPYSTVYYLKSRGARQFPICLRTFVFVFKLFYRLQIFVFANDRINIQLTTVRMTDFATTSLAIRDQWHEPGNHRNSRGERPARFLTNVEKCVTEMKPDAFATSATDRSVLRSSQSAL